MKMGYISGNNEKGLNNMSGVVWAISKFFFFFFFFFYVKLILTVIFRYY